MCLPIGRVAVCDFQEGKKGTGAQTYPVGSVDSKGECQCLAKMSGAEGATYNADNGNCQAYIGWSGLLPVQDTNVMACEFEIIEGA